MVGHRTHTETAPQGHCQVVRGWGRFAFPGRGHPKRGNLPDNEVGKDFKKVFRQGLSESVDHLPGASMGKTLAALTAGNCKDSPFPDFIVEKNRMDLRIAPKRAGYGDGLPHASTVSGRPTTRR